jgi:hypothetical protein
MLLKRVNCDFNLRFGGARMQEGILSLMQMAKISAALHVHQSCANLLYFRVNITDGRCNIKQCFVRFFAEPKVAIDLPVEELLNKHCRTITRQFPTFITSWFNRFNCRFIFKQALSETLSMHRLSALYSKMNYEQV